MLTEFTNKDNVQQQTTGDDIATNLEFLRAAGLPDASLTLPEAVIGDNNASGNDDGLAISGLTEAVKALTKDVSEKMDTFRRRLEALESQSAAPEVPSSEALSLRLTCRRCKGMTIQRLVERDLHLGLTGR